ncbi:interleukin-7 [Ammospiza nelsoni]|uniref:interleukin-7 n=1 Tax=Melospiza georgiana TaxID=44398 RepID=UPI0025AC4647|nr:interleukin-7 [Melospiza georgiana]XP_058670890.1 interleukin-7 [Ammospiza caudacuta]XP_059345793.1 interleukin-7 [Ammospiza nelsoni]
MFHAFFRSTLPVLPLLLVLSPVNASTCAMGNKTTEIRVKYENILSHDINELVNMSAENYDWCCKKKKYENIKVFFCNDTEEIESLQSMACNMLRFFYKQRINKAFRQKAAFVSCGTLQVLQCKCERRKKEKVCSDVFSLEDTETGEQSKKKCNQEVCELKENISSLRSCWNKFEKIISR